MAQSETLSAQKRTKLGSKTARSLRAAGQIPANIQGDGEHLDFSISQEAFLTTRRHHTHLYDIDIDGLVELAVVRELQWDAMGGNIAHVEFKRVIRGVETATEVAIEWVGQPKGGILNALVDHVTIRCIPSLIPDSVEVKVGELEEGQHLSAADIILPEGLSLGIDLDTEIATVTGASPDVIEEPEEDEGDDMEAGTAASDGDGGTDGGTGDGADGPSGGDGA
jgi:large subunit ribosomal protein L25